GGRAPGRVAGGAPGSGVSGEAGGLGRTRGLGRAGGGGGGAFGPAQGPDAPHGPHKQQRRQQRQQAGGHAQDKIAGGGAPAGQRGGGRGGLLLPGGVGHPAAPHQQPMGVDAVGGAGDQRDIITAGLGHEAFQFVGFHGQDAIH